jgi:hypothetical protein
MQSSVEPNCQRCPEVRELTPAFRYREISKKPVILSGAKNPSLVPCWHINRREILRFAQNDKAFCFSAAHSGVPLNRIQRLLDFEHLCA